MLNIIWIIVAILVAFWLIGSLLALIGFLFHVFIFLAKWALILAIILALFNFILGKVRR